MSVTIVLLLLVALQAVAIAALLVRRQSQGRAHHDLRESEERFRLMTDRAPVMIWSARPDTTLDYLNTTCVEFTGRPLDQLLNEGWLDAVHPQERDHCASVYVPAVAARRPFVIEFRLRRADGAYRWVLDCGVPKFGPAGDFAGYLGSCIDITERREAEDRMRASQAALEVSHREIQHLAGRLIAAQDAERARVARDLHDDVSQQLAGMSIAFSGVKQRMTELQVNEELQHELRLLHQRTSTLAQNVRLLSHDLHPTVLRHAGLVAALTAHCSELQRTHGTVLTCRATGDFTSIAPEPALCLYRIAQEALRNVIAHSGASRAEVALVRTDHVTEMTVTDDGRGFDVVRSLERGTGLGLVSITERARLAGGTVNIRTDATQGTRVWAQVPTSSRPAPVH